MYIYTCNTNIIHYLWSYKGLRKKTNLPMVDRENMKSPCCQFEMVLGARAFGFEMWKCKKCRKMHKYKLVSK